MSSKIKSLDFTNQDFFIGIDVHKTSWKVTIRLNGRELKTFSMNPDPVELHDHLNKQYPNARYHSVYEAGFCGFWIHRDLEKLGVKSRVVNPADVPTTGKEKDQKCDAHDSRKLARELENGSLKALYVPDIEAQHLRSLTRLRRDQVANQTRIKNRIKSFLYENGIRIPAEFDRRYWSRAFIAWLHEIAFPTPIARYCLDVHLKDLSTQQARLVEIEQQLELYSHNVEHEEIVHTCLSSVPGISFKTAIALYSEMIDMKRFATADHLNAFVGLIPSVAASGDRESVRGLTHRCNRFLRYHIIEAAWVAVRKDPAFTEAFARYCRRMSKQKAIIRIARKLLNRIRHVWLHRSVYVYSVVE